MRAGEQLKDLRNKLGITTRDVEEFSKKIAQDEGNEDFYISNAWLTQIENTGSIPSIHKLFSLSLIYQTNYNDLLRLFGIDLANAAKYQFMTRLDKTRLANLEAAHLNRSVTFPVRFDSGFTVDRSNLLSRMVEVWGEVPVPLIQNLDLRHSLYGFIGLKDYMLYPLLRPGSFVQIDDDRDQVQPGPWKSELDRPIYFIELREGYACSWCELNGNLLVLVPHPLSPCHIRQYVYPDEAEIVGQVTAVAMRLVDFSEDSSRGIPKLPRRS